jgi:hypothetical protein
MEFPPLCLSINAVSVVIIDFMFHEEAWIFWNLFSDFL